MSRENLNRKLRFSKEHQWASEEANGEVFVGISNYAQESLGDVVFVDVPEVGASFNQGDRLGTIESVKTASDFYAPVTGDVVEVNKELTEAPESLNERPYEAWIVKLSVRSEEELLALMDAEAYEKFVDES
jgi:glycine cleavage system H protein